MNSADQAEAARDWRSRLQNMRTLPGLRADKPDHGALAPLDAEGLAAAAENPDHSEAGRAAAAAAMRERGFSAEPWRVRVPGFLKPADLDRGLALFFGWGRAVRVWSGWAIFLIFAGVAVLAVVTPGREPEEVFGRQSDTVFGLIGLAALISIAAWFGSSALRRKPARILLLRKFNERALSAPLERMNARELRPFGHIVTLSDRHIKDDTWGWLSTAVLSIANPIAAIWFVIGAPVRLVWRLFDRSRMGPPTVLNARDYRNLARRLRDRIGLNVKVALSPKEAAPVRTSDAWWRQVVRLLMDSSDAIVVDLSRVTEGTAWELDVIRDENAASRCVFISLWGKAEEAEAALQRWGFGNPCFYYAPDGEVQRRAQFRAALLDAMRATHGPRA